MGVYRHEPLFHMYREMNEYQYCKEKIEKVGWVPFLEKFRGHHDGISSAFFQSHDGTSVQLGNLKLTITKATIAEATKLPYIGENYFKGIIVDIGIYKKFLKLEHLDPDWSKGISRVWIKEEYCTMLVFLQNF